MMARLLRGAILLGVVVSLGGCKGEPLAGDEANALLTACCDEARSRIELAKDVETDKFRKRCAGCRQGQGKSHCEDSAKLLQQTVAATYGTDLWPMACVSLREDLAKLGIDIPSAR